jgi:hypothetical protein
MMLEIEQARHAEQRGVILRTLKEDYGALMTSVPSLYRVLDSIGMPIATDSLEFHLVYLAQQGYVQIWRASEMPNFRTDRIPVPWVAGKTIVFAKLTGKGLQLVDGDIPGDPKVAF